jgi:hypothetical protein
MTFVASLRASHGLLAILALSCLLVQTGCAGTRFMRANPSPTPVASVPDEATVVFLRPSLYGGAARFFMVDGEGRYLGDLQGREYFVRRFAPGSHRFVAWAENADMVQADLAAGKIYYVLLSVRMGWWTARLTASALTPRRSEWASLGSWMSESRQLVADEDAARIWQGSSQGEIQKRIGAAQEAFDGLDAEEQALRRLAPEDGFDSPQP